MKIGDKVLITKKSTRIRKLWVPKMDNTVGLKGVITGTGDGTIKVEFKSGRRFYYPPESVALYNFVDFLEKL